MAEINRIRRAAALKAWETRRARQKPSTKQAALLKLMVANPNLTLDVGYFNEWITWVILGNKSTRKNDPPISRLTFEVMRDRLWIMCIDTTRTNSTSQVKHYMLTDKGREAIGKGGQ